MLLGGDEMLMHILCSVLPGGHPGADMLMYLPTYGYHIRCRLIWRNTTSSDLSHFEGPLIKIYYKWHG